MDAVLTRTGDASALAPPQGGTHGGTGRLARLLLTMAQTTAERLISPQREPSHEWYRFPLP